MQYKHTTMQSCTKRETFVQRICWLFMMLAALILLYISILALFSTTILRFNANIADAENLTIYSPLVPKIFSTVTHQGFLRFVFVPFCIFISIGICLLCLQKLFRHIPSKRLLSIVLIILACLGCVCIYTLHTQEYVYNDSTQIYLLAQALADNKYELFQQPFNGNAAPYLQMYPFQSTLVVFLSALYKLFTTNSIMIFQVLNLLGTLIIIYGLASITDILFQHTNITNTTIFMLAGFFPLFFTIPMLYGNIIGFSFAVLALLFTLKALESLKAEQAKRAPIYTAVSALCAMAMIYFKPTFSIILIAIMLVWCLALYRARKTLTVIAVIFISLLAVKIPSITTHALEAHIKQNFGQGISSSAWIDMGMRTSNLINTPGWFDFNEVLLVVDKSEPEAKSIISQRMQIRLHEFAKNPLYTLSFVNAKIISEWTNPDYQTLYYASLQRPIPTDGLYQDLFSSHTILHKGVVTYLDGLQTVIYIFAFLACASVFKKSKKDLLSFCLLPLCVIGGFTCFTFWEAKSVYILPFALLCIPYAAFGIHQLHSFLKKRISAHQQK